MESRRTLRLEDIIQKELSALINEETNFEAGIFITITRVEVTKDLQWAKVFVSIYPFDKHSEVLEHLIAVTPQFQRQINHLINIKHTPKIVFKLDTHFEDIDKMLKIVESDS